MMVKETKMRNCSHFRFFIFVIAKNKGKLNTKVLNFKFAFVAFKSIGLTESLRDKGGFLMETKCDKAV